MYQKYQFANHTFQLLPQKAIFWENEKTIILADLHLGKVGHFRKEGLAIPSKSSEKDYLVLSQLIVDYEPVRLLILGDLFHSTYNNEWDIFGEFVQKNKAIKFDLVLGNHDILSEEKYFSIGLNILGDASIHEQIIFTHIPMQKIPEKFLNMSGHIHPGFRLEGIGRQSVTLPCFYQNNGNFILPAFGQLTGLKGLNKTKTAQIFLINGSKVTKLKV